MLGAESCQETVMFSDLPNFGSVFWGSLINFAESFNESKLKVVNLTYLRIFPIVSKISRQQQPVYFS